MNVISSSCGNDSVALIQYAYEKRMKNVVVTYIDTGWAAPNWQDRVDIVASWVRRIGFEFVIIHSMGMESLVRMKKAFPSNQYQFCTQHLKGVPFLEWLDDRDPQKRAQVLVGKRRAESIARSKTVEFVYDSEYHGGRTLWHPLYQHSDIERDGLLRRADFEVLPHRSQECSPCVNANRDDFSLLEPLQIQRVSDLEVSVGRSMFRPKRFNALGIHGVMTWAKYGKKKMRLSPEEIEIGSGCDGYYGCGL
jgi:3'-phosphoadenosine 5'-phosphosulfate sulfotransferase (PAPS reductase)/FAD synthetase